MLVMVFVLFPIVGLDFGHEYSSILSGILKMTNTTRDLIQRMANELDLYRQMARDEARAYLAQPEPTLTVEDCSNMPKHRENFIVESRPGELILDGCFTREDLIEIASTTPLTE